MPKCFKFLLTFSIWETSKWILIAACSLIFTLSVEFAKMGWRNIDSTERVDQGRYVVCALGKSESQYDTFFFFEISNTNFTVAECLRLLIYVKIFLKCSFWDASVLTSCCSRVPFSLEWFRCVVLFFHVPGSLDFEGSFELRVHRYCATTSGLSLWSWNLYVLKWGNSGGYWTVEARQITSVLITKLLAYSSYLSPPYTTSST